VIRAICRVGGSVPALTHAEVRSRRVLAAALHLARLTARQSPPRSRPIVTGAPNPSS
jgi:hypothetical protein